MEKYDHVVVGGGISGLTSALLLGLLGRKVLLVEKAKTLGGSMARFSLQGIPFDTGFHFTGDLSEGSLLHDMLRVLGVADEIEAVPFPSDKGNRYVFESSREHYEFATEGEAFCRQLMKRFPDERDGIIELYRRVQSVCDRTVNMDLRMIDDSPDFLDEDYVSLQSVLDELLVDPELKTILSTYCLCYGVGPDEVSFANHARMCRDLHTSLLRVDGGGGAFVKAFSSALERVGVAVLCGCHIIELGNIENKKVGNLVLSTGEQIWFESCLFTLHPWSILEILPKKYLRKAFIDRVAAFESSISFFSVFGVFDGLDVMDDCLMTMFPDDHLGSCFIGGTREQDAALSIISGVEEAAGKRYRTFTLFETKSVDDFKEWESSSVEARAESYQRYKQRKTKRVIERLLKQVPQLKGHIKVLATSTPLTFRDYLNSPDGSAYGVKQKIGQYNLFGKLPLRNLYVAGQSALLPGLMGAMMSAFITARGLVGRDELREFIIGRLDK